MLLMARQLLLYKHPGDPIISTVKTSAPSARKALSLHRSAIVKVAFYAAILIEQILIPLNPVIRRETLEGG